MQVIFGAVDAIQMASCFFNDTEDVIIQLVAMAFGDGGLPVLGSKDDVVKNLPVGTHDVLV